MVLDPEAMVPAAGQGIVGVTVRADDTELRELLAAIEDPSRTRRGDRRTGDAGASWTVPAARRSAATRGCSPTGELHLTGLVARADGSFLLRRTISGPAADAAALGRELGRGLRADSPPDLFA